MAAINAMGSNGIGEQPRRTRGLGTALISTALATAPGTGQCAAAFAFGRQATHQAAENSPPTWSRPNAPVAIGKIDPIGFGLENFNAAGKWREKDGNGRRAHPIDASGAFHNGPAFSDFFELQELIASSHNEDFARGFTEALIEYGLGRPFGFTDEDMALSIMSSAKDKNYALSEFIHALVQTKEFQSK